MIHVLYRSGLRTSLPDGAYSTTLDPSSLTAPTGGPNADGKRPMKAARAESEDEQQGPLVELPIEVSELITHQLIATLGGDLTSVCKTLSDWCTANRQACADDSVWREAFAPVFGYVVKPGTKVPYRLRRAIFGDDQVTWQITFKGLCKDFEKLTIEGREMWAGMAQWTAREVDEMTARAVNNGTMSGKKSYEPGQSPLIELLIARGGDFVRYYTLHRLSEDLIYAAEYNNLQDMRRLLTRGAWPDFIGRGRVNLQWCSALVAAATNGYAEAVHMLLEAGAGKALDYGEKLIGVDEESWLHRNGVVGSPLYWAVVGGYAAIVEDLLDHGATAKEDHLALAVTSECGFDGFCVIARLLVGKGRVRPTAAILDGTRRYGRRRYSPLAVHKYLGVTEPLGVWNPHT